MSFRDLKQGLGQVKTAIQAVKGRRKPAPGGTSHIDCVLAGVKL
jgi:hypothetical protein